MQRLSLQQKLQQKLSPQQIQLMKMLQLPTIEFEQRIKDELEENPALEEGSDVDNDVDEFDEDRYDENIEISEEIDVDQYLSDDDIPSYKTETYSGGTSSDEEKAIPISSGSSFQEILTQQINLLVVAEQDKIIARQLIGNLDDDGYLRRDIEAIVDDLAFTQNVMVEEEEIERVLEILQSMDPAGVGARSLQECLLIQLKRKPHDHDSIFIAEKIINKYFDDFIKKHYEQIKKKLSIDDQLLKDSIEEITCLNPKPGNTIKESSKPIVQIIPDFIITEEDGELILNLNNRNAPALKVNKTYAEMMEAYKHNSKDKKAKEAILFVKQKLDSAKWFIDAIIQRQNTLYFTMKAIIDYQKDYFLTGDDSNLKPMILKDIADKVDLDISTVSRVANSKYVQTTFGTFLLKSFFTEAMNTESGEEVSTREVKMILKEAVNNEEKRKPLTDEKLSILLKEKGYSIARRTVAKYREQLDIPVARLRKEL